LELADFSELGLAEESLLDDELESPLEADPLPPLSPEALAVAAGGGPSALSLLAPLALLA
jgi:hypothetical protein